MTDAALSLTSSLASSLTKTAPADPAATGASATTADPFAALFAAVTGGQVATTTPMTSMTALAATPIASPVLPTDTILPLPVPTEAALPAVANGNADADDADTKDQSDDPLGDAIAAGATAVLALAPVMVTPVPIAPPPAPTPIAIDGPIASKLPTIGTAVPRAQAFKPRREASDQPAISAVATDTSAPATAPAQTVASPTDNQPQAETDDKSGNQTPAKQTADAKLLAAALPSETLKAVTAALNRPAASTATSATPDPADAVTAAAAVAPAVEAKARTQEQTQAPQVAQQAAPAPIRRQTEDTAERRRIGETRKRAIGPDVLPVDLSQPAAETTRLASNDVAGAVQGKGDTVVQQTLSVAKDGAWLDSLTRDIVASAGSGNDLHFKLEPQNLGSLTVAISQSESGASIRMTAETDTARNILLDAQPKLIAEARAQGLKVSDTQVDLGNQHQGSGQDASRWAQGNAGQNGTAQNGQNRQSSPAHQPFVSNLGRTSDAESESPAGDSSALYA